MPELSLEDFTLEDALEPREGGGSSSSSSSLPWIDVRDYGAVAGGVVDCTAAFQAAALVASANLIWIPAGTWLTTDEVVYAGLRSNIRGAGKWATIIKFEPTAHDKAAFRFTAGAAVDYQCSLRDLSITSANTTFRKKAVRLDDVSEFVLEDVAVLTFSDSSFSSVGIEIRGREWIQLVRPSISADQPIWIKHNPNIAAGDGSEDSDIVHLQDFGLFPHASRYAILVDGDASFTNFLISGSNDSNGGQGGFYWANASITSGGYSFKVQGLWRIEGTSGGWLVYFDTTGSTYRTVVLDGVSGGVGAGTGGFRLRGGILSASFRNCSYTGTGVWRDISNVRQLTFDNCLALGGSTQVMAGMTEIQVIERSFDATNPGWAQEWWTDASLNLNFAGGEKIRTLGIYHDAVKGSLASGATVDLPTFGGSFNRALVKIHADGATQHEFIYGSYDRSNAYVIGSTNIGVGNLASKLCIHWTSPSSIVIRNNLGETINYIAEISIV